MLNAAIRRARSAAHDEDRRLEERFDVFLKTALFIDDTLGDPVTLINMSASGFLARTPAKNLIGSMVAIHLPGIGKREAVIRWSGNGMLGCEFLDPLELDDFPLLLDIIARAGHA